jgi:WW domain-binding protein 4
MQRRKNLRKTYLSVPLLTGKVVTKSLNPMRPIKGTPAPSVVAFNKRKREDGKPKVISKEKEAALKAGRKRVEDREKPLMGLYKMY